VSVADTGVAAKIRRCVTDWVEAAFRAALQPGTILETPSGSGSVTVARYTTENVMLLLSVQQAWAPPLGRGAAGSGSAAFTPWTVSLER
jgi:hypothetical protein